MLSSVVLLAMSFVPGFPQLIFLIIATVVGTLGFGLHYKAKAEKLRIAKETGGAKVETDVEGHSIVRGGLDEYAITIPVVLELGKYLSGLVKKDKSGPNFIDEMIPKMRIALYQDLGVRFPGVHVRSDSPNLEADEYAILLNEVPVIRGKIVPNALLTGESQEVLKRYNIPFTSSKNIFGQQANYVDNKYQSVLEKASIKFWKPFEVMILHLSYFFKQYANEFIGIQEVRAILEFIEKSFPDLVKEVSRLIPLQKMTEIFKRLTQEQISIKDLRTILEALSEWAQSEKDTVLLTEYVRSSLKRYISYKYSQGQSVLAVYLLDPEIEDLIRGAIKQTSAGSYLALDPDSVQMIIHSFKQVVTPTPVGGQPPVLLTSIDVRRFTRKLIESEYPDMAVLSYQEIVPEIKIQPMGRVSLK